MTASQNLAIYGETDIGWCEHTPPNETVDDDGNPSIEMLGFNAADPTAPKRRVYDEPEVQALRDYLRQHNGMPGLEICEPHEVERIARIFYRDGFVVVRNLLDTDALNRFRDGCARILEELLAIPGAGNRKYMTETRRLPHRYSYGTSSASRQLLHDPVWASMVDLPTTTPILTKIFGSRDYSLNGAGGDLCLPGAIEYQTLHSDIKETYEISEGRIAQAELLGIEPRTEAGTNTLTQHTRQMIVERTPPLVTVNFLMSDLTWENGPIRQIPGTHASAFKPPSQADEPAWMRFSTLVGACAGDGVIRDNRAWHGATPNLSREIRAMPNVEYSPNWLPDSYFGKTMPHEIWETLSPHAQHISQRVKTAPGVWPTGAGVMHPLASKRLSARDKPFK